MQHLSASSYWQNPLLSWVRRWAAAFWRGLLQVFGPNTISWPSPVLDQTSLCTAKPWKLKCRSLLPCYLVPRQLACPTLLHAVWTSCITSSLQHLLLLHQPQIGWPVQGLQLFWTGKGIFLTNVEKQALLAQHLWSSLAGLWQFSSHLNGNGYKKNNHHLKVNKWCCSTSNSTDKG